MTASNTTPDMGLPFPKTPEIIFTNWPEALHQSGLSAAVQTDTGAAPWERRLIERLRLQHYAWRTEKT
jgi:hypothetical protein